MVRMLCTLLIGTVAFAAAAQDRAGRDTPSDWKAVHYVPFGLWDSICDERTEDGVLRQRCYLRHVEVYSPRPDFLATFAFVYPEDGHSIVEIGFERDTHYDDQGFRAIKDNVTLGAVDNDCLRSSPCRLAGGPAQTLLDHLTAGDVLVQTFSDRNGKAWRLEWDLSRFDEALEDYRQASRKRGLLD